MGYNNQLQSEYQNDVKTSEQWLAFIAGGRSKTSRKVANNTYVHHYERSGIVAIRLHDTDIVTITPNNTIVLNSGGWLSMTTKERINRYTRAGISQSKGIWYMSDGSLFYDGMAITDNGTVLKPKQPKQYEDALAKIKKQARAYAKDYVKALKAGTVAMPSAGDCWGCYFALSNSGQVPETSRNKQQPFGTDHLIEHMDQGYFVPSLLVNAGREAGYRDDQVGMMGIGGQRLFIDPENNIYKYIVKHLQRGL